ncbi:hypothetical protein ACHAWX_002042 [Stephanocyclus meneghinianus]
MQQIGAQATVNHCADLSNSPPFKSEHQMTIKRESDSPKSNIPDVKMESTLGTHDATVAKLSEASEAQQIGSYLPFSSIYYTLKMARLVAKNNPSSESDFPFAYLPFLIPDCNHCSSNDSKPSLSELNQATADETEDSYIESLKQFVAQQAAVASAAAASANAAMEAIKYHEMMKANGQAPRARFPLSKFLLSVPATSPIKKDCAQNQPS